MLAFELPGGGSDHVAASRVAAALAAGRVPVVVLNACQSGAMGKELEASVATALLKAGCAAVVAMAYRVYAVAAAEFIAAFYESLFAGDSVGQAVTAGRRRLFEHDGRPSPKGDMPLADWLVPVHYMRREVRFPRARRARPATATSPDAALDQIRAGRPDRPRRRKARWLRRPECSSAAMTCSTSWRSRPGCSMWWCWPGRGDGEDRAGQGVRPVAARYRRGRRPAAGFLALVRARRRLLRPGRGDHRHRSGGARRGLRPTGGAAAAGGGETTAGAGPGAADLGQLRVGPGDA